MISIYVPYGQISVPANVYARLDEWARHERVRSGLDSHGRCASAEGRYDATYPDSDRSAVSISFDLSSVMAVVRAWGMIAIPNRMLLKRHFICLERPVAIARALGIHRAQYGHELKRSILMVRNNLTQIR